MRGIPRGYGLELTEVVEEGAALSHAANLHMDNLDVFDELEEDSDGKRDTNVVGSGVEERVSLKNYIEHKEDPLKLLSSLVRFEDYDARKEMLIKFRDNAVREATFLEEMRKAEKKQGTLHGFLGWIFPYGAFAEEEYGLLDAFAHFFQ